MKTREVITILMKLVDKEIEAVIDNRFTKFYFESYESLTSDSPGKVNLSVNSRCPLISVSLNSRIHRIIAISQRFNLLCCIKPI